MSRTPLSIAIGGFDGIDNPGPGPSVARALRAGFDRPLRILATGADGLLAGAWLPGVADGLRTVPDAADDPDGFADAVLHLVRHDRIAAYLPGSTAEVLALARRSSSLIREGLAFPLPTIDAASRVTRLGQVQFLRELGFAVPFSQHVRDLGAVRLAADQIGYPLIVLGITVGALLAYDATEAEAAAHRLGGEHGVILRRGIPGNGYNAAFVADDKRRISGLVIIRRLLADPLGLPACGAVVDEDDLREAVLCVQRALRWRGPLEIDFVRPAGSERLAVTDVRATLPSWSMLTHWAGCNLPVIALNDALGRRRTGRAKPGVLFIRGVDEPAIGLEPFQRMRRGIGMAAPNGAQPVRPLPRNGADGLRVAVTGLGTFDVVNPGLGAARALRNAPGIAAVYGFGYGALEAGIYQPNLFNACFRLPASDSPELLLERLAEICARHPFEVLIPCMDQELPRFIAIQQRLRDLGIAMLLPSKNALDSRAKIALFSGKLPADWGAFCIPESRIVRSEAEAVRAAVRVGMPCAIKGPVARCLVARSPDQIRTAWARLCGEGTDHAIVQRYLDGEIFATAAVCDRGHRTIARTTIKKVAICSRGSTWSAVYVPNGALEESFAAFLQHIRWTGPVEAEFIRDRLTDRFYLFEVNPRFTAWIGYTAALGSNHPLLTALVALDRQTPAATDDGSAVFMRSSIEVPVGPGGFAAFSTRGALIHD